MLANVVDTDQINKEQQTNGCHQFSVSELVKQNSREQPGEKVDNPTKICQDILLFSLMLGYLMPPAKEMIWSSSLWVKLNVFQWARTPAPTVR